MFRSTSLDWEDDGTFAVDFLIGGFADVNRYLFKKKRSIFTYHIFVVNGIDFGLKLPL